jgi:hypothetical protein
MGKDLNKLIESSKKYYENISELKTKILGSEEKENKDTGELSKSENAKSDNKKAIGRKENEKIEKEKDPFAPTKETIEESLKNFAETKRKVADLDVGKFSFVNFNESTIYQELTKPQKFKCLNYIAKSVYNQFSKDEDKKGDLQYFEVSILEEKNIFITSSEKGYYINQSTNLEFNNKPAQIPCFSFTLVGVLSQISQMFKDNFTKLISQSLNNDPSLYSNSPSDKFEWISLHDNSLSYNFRYKGFNYESENNRYSRLNKEWNEEFQAINDLNFNNDPIQNLSKEKLMQEFYKIFKDTAMEGVKLIREKKISSFNFFDNPRTNSGYYMFGNIFFTVLEDNYNNFRVNININRNI